MRDSDPLAICLHGSQLKLTLKWGEHLTLTLWSLLNLDFPAGSVMKNLPVDAGDVGLIPGLGRSLEEEMANYFSILAWKIHGWRSLVGYIQSMGLQETWHNWWTEDACPPLCSRPHYPHFRPTTHTYSHHPILFSSANYNNWLLNGFYCTFTCELNVLPIFLQIKYLGGTSLWNFSLLVHPFAALQGSRCLWVAVLCQRHR